MPMVISPESAYGKELAKFEKPWVFVEFPKMLYRAIKVDGKNICMMGAPDSWGFPDAATHQHAILKAEAITKSNQRIVQNADEEQRAYGEGWRTSPTLALEHAEALDNAIGTAAAEANFHARRMGEGARREHQEATDSTHEHVVDVKPKRKYTRKSKAKPVAVTGSGEVEA